MPSNMSPATTASDTNKPLDATRKSPVKFWLVAVGLVVVIGIGVAAGFIPRLQRQASLAKETRELAIPVVKVVSPKPGLSAAGLPLPAEVKPWVETPVYARANGYLKRRFVDNGSHVEEGQLLAEIDTPELNQELERARGQLTQAEAALGLAKAYSERWAVLLKSGSVSDQENLEKQADYKLKTAAVESARAEVRRLEKLQSFNKVTAPFAGTITARNIDSGDLIVAAGGKELFHLSQTKTLRVNVQVPQTMAQAIHPGQTAELTIPELPGRVFPATVFCTAGAIAADSRTLLVELKVDNHNGDILAGSYAQLRFPEVNVQPLLTLPVNTVMFRAQGPQIGVIQEDGKVELRPVKLGRDFGQTIEVLTGVDSKDRIILNPGESLESGSVVSINEATNAGS